MQQILWVPKFHLGASCGSKVSHINPWLFSAQHCIRLLLEDGKKALRLGTLSAITRSFALGTESWEARCKGAKEHGDKRHDACLFLEGERQSTFLPSDHRSKPERQPGQRTTAAATPASGTRGAVCNRAPGSTTARAGVAQELGLRARAGVARKQSTRLRAAPRPSRHRRSGCSAPTWRAVEDPTPPSRATLLPPSCGCSRALTSPLGSTPTPARVVAAVLAAAPPWRLQG